MIPIAAQFQSLKEGFAKIPPEIVHEITQLWLTDFSFGQLLAWFHCASDVDFTNLKSTWSWALVIKLNRQDVFPGELLDQLCSLLAKHTQIGMRLETLSAQISNVEQAKLIVKTANNCRNLKLRVARLTIVKDLESMRAYRNELIKLDGPTELGIICLYNA